MVAVYPHYFSGTKVPGFGVAAATKPFNPHWTLFFTPHSAHLDEQLIKQARASLWSDDGPSLRMPEAIQRGAQRGKNASVTGYVPSLEPFTFVASHAEEGEKYLVGKRQAPFGLGWLKPDEMPLNQLPVLVNRIAYREFSRDPDLPMDEFKRRLGDSIFGQQSEPQAVKDLLQLQSYLAHARTWCQASPRVNPERVRAMKERGELKPEKAADLRAALEKIRGISERHRASTNPGTRQMHRIARWVLNQWTGKNAELLTVGSAI
jgi:hypothetical protein